MKATQTCDGPDENDLPEDPFPALIVVFSGHEPQHVVLGAGGSLAVGRDEPGLRELQDTWMSRQHARVSFDGKRWSIEDLGSRNGTWVDGARVDGRITVEAPRLMRVGATVTLFMRDARALAQSTVKVLPDGMIVGPTLGRVWHEIAQVAATSKTLHIYGETGAGKEGAARHFHASGSRHAGPFVAVNCAAVPPLLAERLLFGARKGAFSGADANVDGYIQAADNGTLFLDEIGELETGVQAKLLRVLQSGEVVPLGASRGTHANVAICSATHRDLRAEVTAARFREDLYYRISRPLVELPPLRARLEDVPLMTVLALRKISPTIAPDATLVEQALLRPWPGNVRELQMAIADAGRAALGRGVNRVTSDHLGLASGQYVGRPDPGLEASTTPPTREMIEAAITSCKGNVTRAARVLRVHRTSLRRWILRHGISPQGLVTAAG